MNDALPYPPNPPNGFDSWHAFWQVKKMPWRTEPEIADERQAFLAERRAVTPNLDQGIYPFRNEHGSIKLTRADVEWLLATHASGGMQGPVDWMDAKQHGRLGLDLRGADLRQVDLRGLPLAGLRAGLGREEWRSFGPEEREMAAAHLQGARLRNAHAEQASFIWAYVEAASFYQAHLEESDFRDAHAQRAVFREAHLEGASLVAAHLEGANLRRAHLEGTHVSRRPPGGTPVPAQGCVQSLPPARLTSAFFDSGTALNDATLGNQEHGYVSVADARWGGVNLAVVKAWAPTTILGDERIAWAWRPPTRDAGASRAPQADSLRATPTAADQALTRTKGSGSSRQQTEAGQYDAATLAQERLELFRTAVRANRQLATALREQGMNEEADRFAYRALICQRRVLRLQRQYLRAVGSWWLDRIAGYGYRPLRSLGTYILVVAGFAAAYFLIAAHVGISMPPLAAIVFSVTSFHGRGFAPGENVPLTNPLTVLAAGEAILGLLIEITFIATFTQRFFAR